MIEQIDKIIFFLSGMYPPSRDQGLEYDNFVYGKVLGYLKDIMIRGKYPHLMIIFSDPDGDFDVGPLLTLLHCLRQELITGERTPEDIFEEYKTKILTMWEMENLSLPNI